MKIEDRVVIRIQPGAGGEEARLWTGTLARMYTRHAERHG